MSTRPWKRLSAVAVWMMLFALAAANLLLIRQNYQLRAALSKYEPEAVRVGESLPPFSATGLDGKLLRVDYNGEGRRRVFLFFTPSCPHCRAQFPYWREVLAKVDGSRFEVWGLASDSEDKNKVEEYLRLVGCGTDSPTPLNVAFVSGDILRSYKLTSTPTTLVVANDGKVERSWLGRWNTPTIDSAHLVFGFNIQRR